MRAPVPPDPTAPAAWRTAIEAADHAGVTIGVLDDAAGAHAAARLFAGIWSSDRPRIPISAHAVRAFAHTGNYAVGAWAGPDLIGASVGFLGQDDGRLILHSHITGVAAGAQRGRVGFALKQHQRAWALERGIGEITWTFDPLVRRNAWFNLGKLGAVAIRYEPDFYGPMEDGINAGDPSDRCLVRWVLGSPEVTGDDGATTAAGTVLLEQAADQRPVVVCEPDAAGREPYRCWIPADIETVRAVAPALAGEWRLALRRTMGAAMAAGFVAGALTRDGCYVLRRPHPEEPTG